MGRLGPRLFPHKPWGGESLVAFARKAVNFQRLNRLVPIQRRLDTPSVHMTTHCARIAIPNLNNLVPMSIWPGTKGKCEVPVRSEATVGEFEKYL